MFTGRKTSEVQDAASEGRDLARELAKDRKFRREVTAAVRHAALARQRARRRVGLPVAFANIATDEGVRRELTESWARLRSAHARLETKRRRRRLRRSIAILGGLIGGAALLSWWRGRSSAAGGDVQVIQEWIEVDVPVSTAYNQWTQFEEFPRFMEGVEEVRQLDDTRLRWVANVGGKRAEWDAKITEQHPDRQITWASEDGKLTRGTVSFTERGPSQTSIGLSMSYRPEGLREQVGSAAGLDRRRVRGDLERFKVLIESRGTETGAWRGEVSEGVSR
jgi:uncharacterized membrane protein